MEKKETDLLPFESFPREILVLIIYNLDVEHLVALGATSKSFRSFTSDNFLWQWFYAQHFVSEPKGDNIKSAFIYDWTHKVVMLSVSSSYDNEVSKHLPKLEMSKTSVRKITASDIEIKCCFCGGGGVGCTAIITRYITGRFLDEYDPTIEDETIMSIKKGNFYAKFSVIDTAGQEEYSAMRDQYMHREEIFVLVYSSSSRSSFDELVPFRDQIMRVKDIEVFPMILVANKCDLDYETQVHESEGVERAKSWGARFISVSCKTGQNIEQLFELIVEHYQQMVLKLPPVSTTKSKSKISKFFSKMLGKK